MTYLNIYKITNQRKRLTLINKVTMFSDYSIGIQEIMKTNSELDEHTLVEYSDRVTNFETLNSEFDVLQTEIEELVPLKDFPHRTAAAVDISCHHGYLDIYYQNVLDVNSKLFTLFNNISTVCCDGLAFSKARLAEHVMVAEFMPSNFSTEVQNLLSLSCFMVGRGSL